MSSKTYFKEVASDWDNMRKSFFPASVRELALKQIDLTPGKSVGDIGCGTGFITEGLASEPIEIYAIDESDEMLEVMKDKFNGYTNIQYISSESEQIALPNECLHYALANMYLHHVEHPDKAIAEIFRILKPGGKLIITDLDKHEFQFLKEEHNDRWMGFERENVKKWFIEAGYQNVLIDCVNANCCTQSKTSDSKAEISIFKATGTKP